MLRAAEDYLSERDVEAPRLSVEWMLARVLGVGRLQVYMAHDRPLAEAEKQRLRAMVARRGRGEPLAYVLGDQEFYGCTVEVTPDVLIPRPETEGLVERVLAADLPSRARGVDIGTGSGAIALALALARPEWTLLATDVSASALAVAQRNAERHDVADRVAFAEGAYWNAVPEPERFDFVVSNPPYVDPDRPDLLAADVRKFEPALALFTPPSAPATAYEEIAARAVEFCRSGARLFFETGVGAAEAAETALRRCSQLADVTLELDEAGLPRYLTATVRGSTNSA